VYKVRTQCTHRLLLLFYFLMMQNVFLFLKNERWKYMHLFRKKWRNLKLLLFYKEEDKKIIEILLIFNVRGSTRIGGDGDGDAEENSSLTRNEDGDEEQIWGREWEASSTHSLPRWHPITYWRQLGVVES
jgi:hypothetical protein